MDLLLAQTPIDSRRQGYAMTNEKVTTQSGSSTYMADSQVYDPMVLPHRVSVRRKSDS